MSKKAKHAPKQKEPIDVQKNKENIPLHRQSISDLIVHLEESKNSLMLKKLYEEFIILIGQFRSHDFDTYKKIGILMHASKNAVSSLKVSQSSDKNTFKLLLRQNFKLMDLALEITPEIQNYISKLMLVASSVQDCENALLAQKVLLKRIQYLQDDFLLSIMATTRNMTNLCADQKKICVYGYCPHLIESLKARLKESKPDIHVLLVRDGSQLYEKMENHLKNLKIFTTVTNLESLGHFKDFLRKSICCVDFIFSDNVAFAKPGSKIFAILCKAHCPKNELIGCCETFKCINYSSTEWLNHIEDRDKFDSMSSELISTLNTELVIARNWIAQNLSTGKSSFNEKFYKKLFSIAE